MVKKRLNLRKAVIGIACLAVITLLASCKKEPKSPDEPHDKDSYKVLMIFVDEVHAQLPKTNSQGIVNINTKMSNLEKDICLKFHSIVSKWLKNALDGIAKIEVDYYFTTVPIVTADFRSNETQSGYIPVLDASFIPETKDIIDNYQSTIMTINLGFNSQIAYEIIEMGMGQAYALGKHSVCFWDYILNKFLSFLENGSLNQFGYNKMLHEISLGLIESDKNVGSDLLTSIIYVYIHELTHTFESQAGINSYGNSIDYHSALGAYYPFDFIGTSWDASPHGLKVSRLYIRNESNMVQYGLDSPKVGIPHSYWTSKEPWIAPVVRHTVLFDSNGGSTVNPITNIIPDSRIAKPADPVREGYVFDGWYRQNTNVQWEWNKMVNESMILYAKWNPVGTENPALFEILYILNGGSLENGGKTQIITKNTSQIIRPVLSGKDCLLHFKDPIGNSHSINNLEDVKKLWEDNDRPYFIAIHAKWENYEFKKNN